MNAWYEDRIDTDKHTRTVPLRSGLPCYLAVGFGVNFQDGDSLPLEFPLGGPD